MTPADVVVLSDPDRLPCPCWPLEAFEDELAEDGVAERLHRRTPFRERGPASYTVSGVLYSRCAGWVAQPTTQEFYDAIRAADPDERQRDILYTWVTEGSNTDWIWAWAEQAYSFRMLARALRDCGYPLYDRIRFLSAWADKPELVPPESFPYDHRMTER